MFGDFVFSLCLAETDFSYTSPETISSARKKSVYVLDSIVVAIRVAMILKIVVLSSWERKLNEYA